MRLWDKLARGLSLLLAAFFAVVALTSPEMRRDAVLAVVLMLAVGLFGVPLLVRLFSAWSGDEEILERGTLGTATIASLTPTRWRVNRAPVVRFGLEVQAAGLYSATVTQAVDPEVLARLTPGAALGVRVDPTNRQRVVIDWGAPIRPASGTDIDASAAGGPPQPAVTGSAAPRSIWPFLCWGSLAFGLIFLRLGCEARPYETGGATTQGTVLSSKTRNYVIYRFTTPDGRTLEGRATVLPRTWRALKDGDPVEVEYLSNEPETNRIPNQRAGSTTWWILALILLGTSVGLFVRQKWKGRSRLQPAA